MYSMKALVIGRFQPFHKGHLELLLHISKDFEKIIIGIGSSQYSNTKQNPFSGEERKKMIELALKEWISNYETIYIPDIHDSEKWVDQHLSSVF